MKVETRQEPCGKQAYSQLVVGHDWNPKPLNPCPCGAEFDRWSAGRGHECGRCGKRCDGACR